MTDTAALQTELTRLQAIRANGATQVRQPDGTAVTYDMAAINARIREIESALASAADPTGTARQQGARYLVATFPE